MGFKRNYIEEINEILMKKRNKDDVRITLNIPEHKFKKNSEKFNYALKSIYEKYKDDEEDVKLFHLLLSLQEYFDMEWLVENILDDTNKKIVKSEMIEAYNIKVRKENREVKYYANEELEVRDLYDDSDLKGPVDLFGDEE